MSTKNLAASVYDQLSKLAKESKRSFDELLLYYGMERFLYRLSKSEHAEKFILKGALMFHVWDPKNIRATRDIDFLGHMSNELDAVKAVISEICALDMQDGLVFQHQHVKAERIKEDADYEGVRLSFIGKLATAKIPMQLDIGFGDTVHPKPSMIQYPALLEDEAPRIKGYPPETVVAEKFQAMVHLGEFNSRLKDFYDLWHLARSFDFDGAVLSQAIQETFKRRGTSVDLTPVALTGAFSARDDKQAMWAAFLKRTRLGPVPANLQEIADALAKFLLPIAQAINQGEDFKKKWKAAGPWK